MFFLRNVISLGSTFNNQVFIENIYLPEAAKTILYARESSPVLLKAEIQVICNIRPALSNPTYPPRAPVQNLQRQVSAPQRELLLHKCPQNQILNPMCKVGALEFPSQHELDVTGLWKSQASYEGLYHNDMIVMGCYGVVIWGGSGYQFPLTAIHICPSIHDAYIMFLWVLSKPKFSYVKEKSSTSSDAL